MATGIAYPAFEDQFKVYFKDLEVVTAKTDLNKFNLIIFSGGADVNPIRYGENNRYSSILEKRDEVEFSVLRNCRELNSRGSSIKILGVCRGHQLVNVGFGGKLYQDLYFDAHVKHPAFHPLRQDGISKIISFFQSGVNSFHHQGVKACGRSLHPTSSYNGVIESTESNWVITVQWHPEFFFRGSDRFFEYINKWAVGEESTEGKKKVSMKDVSAHSSGWVSYINGNSTATDESFEQFVARRVGR